MIHLICPSRGRPDLAKRMWESAQAMAVSPDKLNLHLGIHDYESSEYKTTIRPSTLKHNVAYYHVKDWSTVFTTNTITAYLMKDANAKLFMVACDDTIFSTQGWDKALIEHYNALEYKAHVYALQDSRSADGTPHPIVTREYIRAMGYLFTPIFLHWFVDTWLADIAKANNCFTHLNDYLLVHDKPSDKGLADDTHIRIRERGWPERDTFTNEKCGHFLDEEKARLGRYLQWQSGAREHLD